MAGTGKLVDLLLFYTVERALFNRMVRLIGKNSQEVKTAIAFWLLLEEIGYHDLIRMIYSRDDKTIEALFIEALQYLEFIESNAVERTLLDDHPLFQGPFDEPMNYRFFYYNREFMRKRYMHIMENVCNKIFSETAAMEVDESGIRPVVRLGHLGQDSIGRDHAAFTAREISAEAAGSEAARASDLNAEASEFYPRQTPEDARTMFLTFSKGHPLTSQEIIKFFQSKWGEVVQDVFIEPSRPGEDPQFGRIIFTTSTVIARVLNGQSKAKFLVNHKHLWARVYVRHHGGKRMN